MTKKRIQQDNFAGSAPIAACILLFSLGCFSQPVQSQELPVSASSQIRAAWLQAAKVWKPDAEFVCLDLERDSAQQGYESDFFFRSNSDAHLYHIKRGPRGNSAGADARPAFAWGLTSKVIDPAKAVSLARAHGMKGNVLTAMLEWWTADPVSSGSVKDNEIPIGLGVEVWRIVPDNDPNTADPNDPNMKNYFVDAVTGAYYDVAHLNVAEYVRNSQSFANNAMTEYVEIMRSARH